ncbi:MAG: site-specific integrase [Bacteroidetes bacterium]|nr:site-specific integrase [Bacteroidota bacterium]
MIAPTTGIHLDRRRETKEGYPVKLRVTFCRQPRYFDTGQRLSAKDFQKLAELNPRGELKEIKVKLSVCEKKAGKIIEDLGEQFSFEKFKELYFGKSKQTDLIAVFTDYINKLNESGRAGTASSYQNARNSIIKYIGEGRKRPFVSITPEWLEKYEKAMKLKGNSLTTIGIYTRSLRTIFNIAIRDGIVSSESYPFGKGKYQIPATQNTKKALNKLELKQIFEHKPDAGTWEETAHDIWMFSYLCNGANIKDICRLKNKNLSEKSITFLRAKTERTAVKKLKNIVASRTDQINAILKRQGTRSLNQDQFVFPFLDGSESPQREQAKIRQVVKNINKWMGIIGAGLELKSKITTYTARHSFATILKRGGAPTEYISESLGHSNLKTTESYLDSFEDETKEKFANMLTDFG